MASRRKVVSLYRSILHQARLLSHTWDDRTLFTSHAFLARANLEPLLLRRSSASDLAARPLPSSSTATRSSQAEQGSDATLGQGWPPSTAQKRYRRGQTALRHLADANVGWTHAATRALELAYARRGKLRRDALSLLSSRASTSLAEQRYPPRLRRREVHPILAHLLTSQETMDGSPARPVHLVRPPPPYLPALDDPLVVAFQRRPGRRRESNAWRKWFKQRMQRVVLPLGFVAPSSVGQGTSLFDAVEAKAARLPIPLPRRARRALGLPDPPPPSAPPSHAALPAFLARARRDTARFASSVRPQALRRPAHRTHGWTRAPRPFATTPRARRRTYAHLLQSAPVLHLHPPRREANGVPDPARSTHDHPAPRRVRAGRDPLRLRQQLCDAMRRVDAQQASPAAGVSTHVSEHATRRRGPRGAPRGSEQTLRQDEVRFLQRSMGVRA